MPFPLLSTKIGAPPLQHKPTVRRGLAEQVTQGIAKPVTLVSAPPGCGKTTLVQHWRSTAGSESTLAWYSIGREDDNQSAFLTYLAAALQAAAPEVGRLARELLGSPQLEPATTVVTSLLNDIASYASPLVLVLDDYHWVRDPAVHEAVAFLLAHQPPNLHVVIVTRSDPPLPLARLRAQGRLCEIRSADLRFGEEEAEAFLNRTMGLSLTREQVAALEARTEGWVVGLQLAALSLQGHPEPREFLAAFTGNHQFVLDYLVEEVLQRQTPERLEFLLKTSVLERLSGGLCDAVTGRSDGSDMLPALAHENLFTAPLDSSGTWFRYHQLFAECLRSRLRRSGEDVILLQARAAQWCEDQGLFEEALGYAFAAADTPRASRILDGFAHELWRGGRVRDMLTWFARLPAESFDRFPRLALTYALAEMFYGHFDRVLEHLAVARRGYASIAGQPGGPPLGELLAAEALATVRYGVVTDVGGLTRAVKELPQGHPLHGTLHFFLGLARWMSGDLAPALDAFERAREISLENGDRYDYQIATLYLVRVLATGGDWNAAEGTSRELLELDGGRVICAVRTGLAALLLERGDLEEAETLLEEDRSRASELADAWVLMGSTATLARLRLAQGRAREASELMGEAVSISRRHGLPWTWVTGSVQSSQVRILVQLGRLEEAEVVLERMATDQAPGMDLPLLREGHEITETRMLLARAVEAGDRECLASLERRLVDLDERATAGARVLHRVEVLDLLATARDALGDREGAKAARAEHLRLAPVRPTVGRPLVGAVARTYEGGVGGSGALSSRELQVLRLMAEGHTNKQIARTLDIALDTAKKHASNVMQKLGSNNRTQAVARAREMRLL